MAQDFYQSGLALTARGQHGQAIAAFESALGQNPQDARVLYALAATARRLNLNAAARSFYDKVLALEPGRMEALNGLASLCCEEGDGEAALRVLTPALGAHPQASELYVTRAIALRQLDRLGEAEAALRTALHLDPDLAPALGNLGDCLADQGDLDGALALYDRLLRRHPEHHAARLNRAILHFLKGELKAGWRDYAARLQLVSKAPRTLHRLKPWCGGTLKNTRLLLTAEQGVGDQIMFASLVPELATKAACQGGRLILECDARLQPLFARSFAGVAVHPAQWQAREGVVEAHYGWLAARGGANAAIALGSLARYLRPDREAFPRPHAYLSPDADERAHWQAWCSTLPPGRRLGICWRSGKLGGGRSLQYAPLSLWAERLREVAGELICVQYDASDEEIAAFERQSGRRLHVPPQLDQKRELDRCAGLLSALDAVISAPTAVSWLAAGCGVPTFKLLYDTSWTGFGADYEPFAPCARLIGPERAGDWLQSFAKLRLALG